MSAARGPRGLSLGHFRKVATAGFGDSHNSYAYTYAWYDDHLYVGTNRDLLVLARTRFKFEIPTAIWPVEVPEKLDPAEAGGQIWRYSPQTDVWQRVFKSPLTEGVEGRTVPLATGFRNMAVFQGASDARPALYTIPSCGSYGIGPVMLRSTDGTRFEQISEQGLGLGDPNITAFRSMLAFKGRLWMTPAGSRGGDPNVSYHASILCSDDPAHGGWKATNESGFGDPTNYGVYDMCVSGDYLYAGTMNIRTGCQLWKTDGEGEPPFRWTKVFDRGADRAGYFNQGVVSIASFGGNVYLGTGIQNGGFDRVNNIGPAPSEIIRVYPDDTWDLVVGEPRMTRSGLKSPASGYGAGFDNPFAGYMWRMAEHEGCLYVGTYDSSAMFPFARFSEHDRKILDPTLIEGFMRWRGGCELWRTQDGNHWVQVTRNGFGNPYNWGIRTLISTPRGLFVGTANPFGPRVAIPGAAGWRYEENPRGGIEVWHGSLDHHGGDGASVDEGLGVVPMPLAGLSIAPEEAALELPTVDQAKGDLLDDLIAEAVPLSVDESVVLHMADSFDAQWQTPLEDDPQGRLSREESESDPLPRQIEEEIAEYYHGSALRSVGYWRDDRFTPAEASRALIVEMIALWQADHPEEHRPAAAQVLVVGRGGSELAEVIDERLPGAVVEVLDPLDLLVSTQEGVWGKRRVTERVHLDATDATYDLVLWVEATPRGRARREVWAEVRRVLRPDGAMVAAEVLGLDVSAAAERGVPLRPLGSDYEDLAVELKQGGFATTRVIDATHHAWFRYCRHSREYFTSKLLLHHLDRERLEAILAALPGGAAIVEAYLLVYAAQFGERPNSD